MQSFMVDNDFSKERAVVVGVKYRVTFDKKKSIMSMHVGEKHVVCVPWCFDLITCIILYFQFRDRHKSMQMQLGRLKLNRS